MTNTNFAFSPSQRRRLWRLLGQLASDYWDHAADDRTPVLEQRGRRRAGRMPERGRAAEQVLREAAQYISRNACHISSPRYYGLMNPKAGHAGVFGDALTSVLNQQLALETHAPGAHALEQETLGWFLAALGWRRGLGQFTTGGSEANLIGLKVALNAQLPAVGARGLRGLRGQPTLYVSDEAHYSIEKFADLLGLGREAIRRVPTDRDFSMRPEALVAEVRKDRRRGRLPFCVVGTFGTTSSGAIDPIAGLARVCRRERLWLHVDGAYGGSVILSRKLRRLWSGLRGADSFTFDPHKWLAMPFPLGAVLVRDRRATATPFYALPAYVPRGGSPVQPYQLGVQGSRRVLGLKLWVALQVHGRGSFEALLAEHMRLAGRFRALLAASPHFGTVTESELPITCFTFCGEPRGERRRIPVELLTPREQRMNLALAEEMVRRGWAWLSSTRLRGVTVLRMMVMNYDTREHHLRRLVADLEKLARDPAVLRAARRAG